MLGGSIPGVAPYCARRAAASRVRDDALVGAEASRLLCYYRQRLSVSLQRSQARAIHHRSARAVHSTLGAGPLALPSGFVGQGDLHMIVGVARFDRADPQDI
jgi:hypothetical protein